MIRYSALVAIIIFGAGAAGCLIGWLVWSAPLLGLVAGEVAGAGGLGLALWLLGRVHFN